MSTIGMMEGAFFVGRKEIMDWINGTLDLNLAKVEDTANGAVACQLLDIMYPNQVPMHKVNWSAKQDFEFIANYKILQNCFSKFSIDRNVDVDRLISGRYMDNLEFMQWFKKFFELSVSDKGDYDSYGQRCKGKGGAQFNGGKRTGGAASKPSSAATSKPAAAKTTTSRPTTSTTSAATNNTTIHNKPHTAPAAQHVNNENNRNTNNTTAISNNHNHSAQSLTSITSNTNNNNTNNNSNNDEVITLRAQLEESRRAYTELKLEMDGTTKEREFYFEKLRDIEVLLQEVEEKGQGNEVSAAIFKILYATADGFEVLAEENGQTSTVGYNANDDGYGTVAVDETY